MKLKDLENGKFFNWNGFLWLKIMSYGRSSVIAVKDGEERQTLLTDGIKITPIN